MSEDELSNVIDSTTAKRWAGEILGSWKKSRDIREDAKEKIRPDLEFESEHRQGLYEAAEAAGLPLNALKLEVARQKDDWENELRKRRREEKAGDDILELADQIKEVLGDFAALPLGQAAVKAAAPEKKKGRGKKAAVALVGEDKGAKPKTGPDDEPDLRSAGQKDKEAQRQADAEERLKGIKPIDGAVPVQH